MPRRKISEFRAKKLINESLGLIYKGWMVQLSTLDEDLRSIKGYSRYVVKVDQGVKGRYKKGLMELNVPKEGMKLSVTKLAKQGYRYFIVEPYLIHDRDDERYLALSFGGSGLTLSSSSSGGVDIEQNATTIKSWLIDTETDWDELTASTGISRDYLQKLINLFMRAHFVFLEINPYVVSGKNNIRILDAAVEVDDAAGFMVDEWSEADMRYASKLSDQEDTVKNLDEGSVASFNLSIINPHGSIFLLLSGGGASIVVADEVFNLGYGGQLANYGEYSGNPSYHETVKYTSQILELLLASKAPEKILFIGGAVANFTDIAVTFAGIIEALNTYAARLKKHNVKVFVRRGGPNQEEGLRNMRQALEEHGILGAVNDATIPITEALHEAVKGIKK